MKVLITALAMLVSLSPKLVLARGGPIGPSVAERRANSPATASIEGIVLKEGTSDPVVGAEVRLIPNNFSLGAPQPTRTDDQGRFVFKELDGGIYGTYRMQFQARGYVSQQYGQRTFPGVSTPITLAVGQALKDFVMYMKPTGTVAGRIRDSSGKPLSGVPVYILRPTYDSRGQKSFSRGGNGRTDDQGEYRIFWASPGKYYVAAGGPVAQAGVVDLSHRFPNEVLESTTAAFFPSAEDSSGAVLIEVKPGAETSGIDFSLRPVSSYKVRGRVVRSAPGPAPASVQVTVVSLDSTAGSFLGSTRFNGFYDPAAGTVEVAELAPGNYQILAMVQESTGPSIGTARPSASLTVRVEDSDIENLVWTPVLPSVLNGRFTFDGPPPAAPQQLRLNLRPPVSIAGSPQAQPPDALGNFRIENVLPGTYDVDFFPPATHYVKEVRFGGADVLGRRLRLEGTETGSFEVVLSSKGAQLDGILTDERLQPVAVGQVVLIPDIQRDRPDLYKMVRTDQNGRFTIPNIPPGPYKVFAWEAIDQNFWFDPAVLREYEQKGKPIRLTESSKETVEVKLIPVGGK